MLLQDELLKETCAQVIPRDNAMHNNLVLIGQEIIEESEHLYKTCYNNESGNKGNFCYNVEQNDARSCYNGEQKSNSYIIFDVSYCSTSQDSLIYNQGEENNQGFSGQTLYIPLTITGIGSLYYYRKELNEEWQHLSLYIKVGW